MSIDKLTEQEWQTNEAIARRLNVVIEAVEALRRQFEQHIAAEDGADGEGVLRRERGGLCGWCGQPLEPDWASEKAHMMEAYAALRAENVAMRKALSIARKEADWQRAEARVRREDGARICAERDAAQARVAELEQERDDLYQQVDGLTKQVARLHVALENAAGPDAVREAIYQSVEAGEADYPALGLRARQNADDAALGALVRRMQRRVIVERLRDGTYSVGLRGEPRVYFRDEERTFAWAADAALGEE